MTKEEKEAKEKAERLAKLLVKINNKTIVLDDQENVLEFPEASYDFLKLNLPGIDFEKCQKVICQDPYLSYLLAMIIPGADIKYCEKMACQEQPYIAYIFAMGVIGADIEYCQSYACKNPKWAYWFEYNVVGADAEYCRKNYGNDEYYKKPHRQHEHYEFYGRNFIV